MESLENKNDLKAIVIGATGASGRELTDILLKSKYFSKVTVLVRRTIDRWENLNEEEKKKLNLIKCDNLDILSKEKDELVKFFGNETQYDSLFCCLGSRTGKGKEEFRRVDYDYVVYSAILCEKFNIPHFSSVSSGGVDANSWFLYLRTKGEADNECLKRDIKYISIFRPGLLVNRDNDSRFVEKCLKFVPFIPKIEITVLSDALYKDAVNYNILNKIKKDEKVTKIWKHDEIIELQKNTKI